jgi:hypothetical protein
MSTQPMLHNPAFLSDDDLERAFVVREVDLQLLLETIRENTGAVKWHVLVVGQRGMGKTTLMRRLALAVRQDRALSRLWYPILFSEESYEVLSAGEFWLKALFHLSEQTQEPRWREAYEELLAEGDEQRLHDRAVEHLTGFAAQWNVRLLLVAENLDMLFGEQLKQKDREAWRIREVLEAEQAFTLVGTAMGRFDQVERDEAAFNGMFEFQELRPLDVESCRVLWNHLSGWQLDRNQIRPLQILTGGSPRLLTILSSFAAGRTFHGLMDELPRLIDERTSYFKANLDALPAYERKIFVTLADIWAPATAREVADRSRIDVNRTSALLRRLVTRGMVTEYQRRGRRIWYQVAERLFNVYHLMRRRGGESIRVRAMVDFMVCFYGDRDQPAEPPSLLEELEEMLSVRLDAASDARSVLERTVNEKPDFAAAWGGLVFLALEQACTREQLRALLNRGIRLSNGHPAVLNEMAWEVFRSGRDELMDDATALARIAVDRAPDVAEVHHTLASLFARVDRWDDALDVARQCVNDPGSLGVVTADLVTFFVEAAAAGHSAEAIEVIVGSACHAGLEPVVVALRQDVGHEAVAPIELREIARDVTQRIQIIRLQSGI